MRGNLDDADLSELTLIMSDRAAQRYFQAEPARGGDVASATEPPLSLLARQLHGLSALGGPGTGLVGVGPALGSLHGLGLGNDKDVAQCLEACGIGREQIEAVSAALRNGGVLVFINEESQRELLKERGQELALELPENIHAAAPPVIAPAAPVSEQNATYNRLLMPTDVTDRNR